MEAGFVRVVEVGQHFMTKDTGDFRQFRSVACREYTLPRDDQSAQPKGWIQTHDRTGQPVVNCDKDHGPNKRSQGMINVLTNIDFIPSNVQFSHQEALLYVFDDNEAVIRMIHNET